MESAAMGGGLPPRASHGDSSETNGLMTTSSETSDPDARLDLPPARGRCMTAAITLAATTACGACAALGVHLGQMSRAASAASPQDASIRSGERAFGDDIHRMKAKPSAGKAAAASHDADADGDGRTLLSEGNLFDVVAQEIYRHELKGLWQVHPGHWPDVLSRPSAEGKQLDSLEQCQVVSGTAQSVRGRAGRWIKLQDGGSASRKKQEHWVDFDSFESVYFTMSSVPGLACHEEGHFAVASADACHMAARSIGLSNTTVSSTTLDTMPEGCSVFNGSALIMNTNPNSQGNGGGELSRLICTNLKPCVPITSSTLTSATVTPTSTTATYTGSTTGTKIWDELSFFCFVLAEADSYEAGLLRFARREKTGIYGCEEHMTLTDNLIDVGTKNDPEPTVPIGSLKCDRGSWGSWANAPVFLKAWKAVMKDGRFRRHDWIVKLDADTVFHPDRLKWHVGDMNPQWDKIFLQNYLDGYPVVGAIEVATKAAMLEFENRVDECEWIAYGAEDDWFVKCMRKLGAWSRRDDNLLQHEQHPGGDMCYNGNFVAMHPHKDQGDYERCLRAAQDNSPWRKLQQEWKSLTG